MEFGVVQMEIVFYCGIGEKKWNHHPVDPGPYACISPVIGQTEKSHKENSVYVPRDVKVIQDSGAFSDGPNFRVSPEKALERQILHSEKYGYKDQITHLASYDLLIDERWLNGRRFKERWSEDEAETAVKETVDNAVWLSNHRQLNLILSAQGTSPQQYKRCAEQIIPLLQDGDIFGFGGWCITGKMRRRMMPLYAETMSLVFPLLGKYNIKRAHLWGVLLAEALAETAYWAYLYDVQISTDSVGPSVRPAFGSWGYADWRDSSYKQPPTSIRGLERARHVKQVRQWLSDFDIDKYLNPMYDVYRVSFT